jgi:hypothetical protein
MVAAFAVNPTSVAADLDYYVSGPNSAGLAEQVVEVIEADSSGYDNFWAVVDLIWGARRSAGYDAALFTAKEIFVSTGHGSSVDPNMS